MDHIIWWIELGGTHLFHQNPRPRFSVRDSQSSWYLNLKIIWNKMNHIYNVNCQIILIVVVHWQIAIHAQETLVRMRHFYESYHMTYMNHIIWLIKPMQHRLWIAFELKKNYKQPVYNEFICCRFLYWTRKVFQIMLQANCLRSLLSSISQHNL